MNKRMVILTLMIVLIGTTSCSSFNKLAAHNKFTNDDMMTLYYNEGLNLQSHTFGDFKFANNKKEFKKINSNKPAFRNIILYARTYHPAYEYYILLNAKPVTNSNYLIKDTLINNNRITLAMTKDASAEDFRIIAGRIATLKSTSINETASDK